MGNFNYFIRCERLSQRSARKWWRFGVLTFVTEARAIGRYGNNGMAFAATILCVLFPKERTKFRRKRRAKNKLFQRLPCGCETKEFQAIIPFAATEKFCSL